MQKKVFFYNRQKEKLAGILHIPNKPSDAAVIISHGFGSGKSNKGKWSSSLCNAGFLVLRFDFSGHGESEGLLEEITFTKAAADMESAIAFARSLGAKRIGLTGHSLGGTASLLAAGRADAVAAIEPPADFHYMREMLGRLGVDAGEWRRKGYAYLFGKKVNYSFYKDAMKYDAKSISKGVRCPALIVQGNKDDTVPLGETMRLFDALRCEKKLEILKGAGHDISGKAYEKTVEMTKEWFKRRLA